MNRCEQEKRLTPYLLGDLSEREEADFSRHLAECAACQECARELTPVLQALTAGLAKDGGSTPKFDLHHQLKVLTVPPESTHRVLDWMSRSRPWLVAAASALVVTGLSYFLLFSSMSRQYGLGAFGVEAYRVPKGSGTASVLACVKPKRSPSQEMWECEAAATPQKTMRLGMGGGSSRERVVSFGAPDLSDLNVDADMQEKGALLDKGLEVAVPPPQMYKPVESEGLDLAGSGMQIGVAGSGLGAGPATPEPAYYATLDEKTRLVAGSSSHLKLKGVYTGRTAGGRETALREYAAGVGDRASVDDDSYSDALGESKKPAKQKAQRGGLASAAAAKRPSVQFDLANIRVPATPLAPDANLTLVAKDIESAERKTTAGWAEAKKVEALRAAENRDDNGRDEARRVLADKSELYSRTSPLVATNAMPTALPASGVDIPDKPRPPRRVAQAFNPFIDTAVNHFSTFAIDVSTASYNLTRQALRSGGLPDPDVVRTEEILNAFDYGDTAPDHTTFRVYVEGAPSAFGAPGLTMLRIGVKGKRLGREEQRPAMLTFLIDTSGSMAQPDRIGRARTALRLLLDQLAPTDKLQIVSFDDKARVVLSPTPASQKDAILKAFDALQCNGSTNLEDGMRRAYEQAARAFVPGGENRVVLLSDGVANLGADNAQDILRQVEAFRKQGVTCSVFGVGEGTYNDAMLVDLANKGQGVYRFLDSDEEVKRVFVDDLAATLNNIATDVKIQVEWSAETVRRFRQLGYERRALQAEQFRDDTVEAGEVASGQAVTALYELDLASNVRHAALGTVRVRYRRVDNGMVEEIAQEITPDMIAPTLQATRPQLRLAVGAAAFAELLRGSPHMVREYAGVTKLLRAVAQELPIDPRVNELRTLAEAAEGLSK